jgi:predicted dehydrogenase
MRDLKFAVLGTGFWAGFQVPAWFEVGGVNLVAAYNRTRARAEAFAERFGVPRVYDDPEALFKAEELDFVDIVTEVQAHAPLVALAAKYRVPVICQKPMAADCTTAGEMVHACEAAGIPFFIHENFRYQRPLRAVKEILDTGEIGHPFRARIQFVHSNPAIFENQPLLKTLERFAVADLGVHLLDLARFYFGEPDSLYCQTYRTRDDIAGEDVATIVLSMGDVTCTCEISYSTRTEWGHFPETFVYVEGHEGTLELGPDCRVHVTTEAGTRVRAYAPPRYAWADPDYALVHASIVDTNRALLESLRTGRSPETSAEDNIKTVSLMCAAYDSAERNQVIQLT